MTCQACSAYEANRDSRLFETGCRACNVRYLALMSHEFHKSQVLRRMTAGYMAQLRQAFGDDWNAGHQKVKQFSMESNT